MSFLNKLSHFRESGAEPTSNEQQQAEEAQDVSIRDLWQQAVNIHKEKLNAITETEEDSLVDSSDQRDVDNPVVPPAEPIKPMEEPQFVGDESIGEELDVPIVSLAQITAEELRKQADHTLENIFEHYRTQAKTLFGQDLPSVSIEELKLTQLGQDLDTIVQAYRKNGRGYPQAIFAVQRVLSSIWKPVGDQEFRIPEPWYQTPLGFVCRYILAGQSAAFFDPIDLETAASMLGQTERSVIENYPKLGGVRLSTGYVFSKQKIEEYKQRKQVDLPLISNEWLEKFYRNSSIGMKKLLAIRSFLNEAYDQVRYLRDLLVYNIDFGQNRIRQAIKGQTEECLAELYQSFLEIKTESIERLQINKNDFLEYHIPNLFSPIDRLEGNVINGEAFIHSLEETIKGMDEERVKVNRLIDELAKSLGYLNLELGKGIL